MNESYYTKDAVYGDDALLEIIYELEDNLCKTFEYGKCIDSDVLGSIFERHINTVEEYKKRNKLT